MKAKISRGGGFRGGLNYVFDEGKKATGEKKPEIVGGNLSGQDARSCSKEFAVVRNLRPDIAKPVWHCSLALPPGDRLSAEKWDEVSRDFMHSMKFGDDTPYIAVRHQDTDKDHIHIIASRVSLSGEVWLGRWEARRAIEATQALEQKHGLTLTPGLGDARAEKKALTRGEINMAVNTGVEPPRQKLQRLVDEAIQGNPGALEFAERLRSGGVEVRPNLAGGKMNGFGFRIDGQKFKGQSLGGGYTWASLQKKGMTYEQTRDNPGLERLRTEFADRSSGADVAADHTAIDSRSQPVTGGDRATGGAGTESRGDLPGAKSGDLSSGRADIERDSQEAGRASHSDQPLSADNRPAAGSLDSIGKEGAVEHKSPGQEGFVSRQSDGPSRGSGIPDTASLVGSSPGLDPGGDRQRVNGGDKLSRFRISSAQKRRQAGRSVVQDALPKSDGGRMEGHRRDLKTIDPTPYLENQGFDVVKEGRHHSVKLAGDEVYRLTEKPDGTWLWCDNYQNKGGDNLDLVKELEPQKSFADRVYTLTDEARPTASNRPTPRPRSRPSRKPKLPPQDQKAVEQGRKYLLERKLSQTVIDRAEQQGFLRYCSGGVFFCGYDETGEIAAATKRATNAAAEVQKKDLFGTDKSCPPILRGGRDVWIVEGGADALALQDIKERAGEPRPTVIVSGGARVYSFLERSEIRELLKDARSVTVAYEKEDTPSKQEQTDAGHDKQKSIVTDITGKDVDEYRPGGLKDLASTNALHVEMAETKAMFQKQEDEKEQRSTPYHDQDHSPGMSR